MPPIYKNICIKTHYDGKSLLIKEDITFKYVPGVIPPEHCKLIYDLLNSKESPLKYHTYIGSFGRVTRPKRKTYALVPQRSFYRYKGKNLTVYDQPLLEEVIGLINPFLDQDFDYDSAIFNGYSYNNEDNISLHIDDEKFLQRGNYPPMVSDESIVCTITILNPDGESAMYYNCANPNDVSNGCSVLPQNGSILYQGAILHEVTKKFTEKPQSDKIGRFSITLRKLTDKCPASSVLNKHCNKISCVCNYGPSNYIYYNNHDCIS